MSSTSSVGHDLDTNCFHVAALNDHPQGSHGLRTTVTVLYSVPLGQEKKYLGPPCRQTLRAQKYASVRSFSLMGFKLGFWWNPV
ncbi:hypothetical protein BDV26DRAFT_261943 [Aspergillus bertholletiae]|uniref:Uncharacterized protein n=1 Tax=Aspergillus bertholletiae TaxID=1226010 RepID=A0A5N7B8Y7_9EURO|nr:hypothetical protein BDV26DRAFT_261943 [Aspergillus bertholletiae]